MRALVDMVDNFTGTVRFIICAMVVVGLGAAFMLTAGVSYVAPKVAEDYGERAERIGEKAIAAAQEEARAHDLAKDGWGYSEPRAGSGASRDAGGDEVGGWGDGAE